MGFWNRFKKYFATKETWVDPNAQACEYLKYYFTVPDAPNYAVLLTGPWGGGKTYLIKRLLRELRNKQMLRNPWSPRLRQVYVSLYGIKTREEFDRAVLAARYPFVYSRSLKAVAQLTGAIFSIFRMTMKVSPEEYLSKFNAELFVFDDLERCDMPIATALGCINPFVEHAGCKVIIICNELEIRDAEQVEYRRRKEKVVGQTHTIEPDLESALAAFVDRMASSHTKTFLSDNAHIIRRVAAQSGHGNLRVLQQALWDFSRFHKALPLSFLAQKESIVELVAPFLAFAIEFKTGNFTKKTLDGRSMLAQIFANAQHDDNAAGFKKIASKYAGADLGEGIFGDDLLIQMFERGAFETERIHATLKYCRLFARPEEIPSWRLVWDKEIVQDDQVKAAVDDLEAKFAAYKYILPGEILHVFGLRLKLAAEGLVPGDRAAMVTQGKAYVDELERQGRLSAVRLPSFGEEFPIYEGLGFIDKNTIEFRELYEYFLARQANVLRESYPKQAQQLLQEMEKDEALFARRITFSGPQDSHFATTPILHYIEVNQFIDSLFNLSNHAQRAVLVALQIRYNNGHLANAFAEERSWLEKLHASLLDKAARSEKIAQVRIETVVGWTIGQVLCEVVAYEKAVAEEKLETAGLETQVAK